MTGCEAKQLLDLKIKDYWWMNGAIPKLIHLPVLIAYDLEKCVLSELGPLCEDMCTDGIEALETYGYQGIRVKLERSAGSEIMID